MDGLYYTVNFAFRQFRVEWKPEDGFGEAGSLGQRPAFVLIVKVWTAVKWQVMEDGLYFLAFEIVHYGVPFIP